MVSINTMLMTEKMHSLYSSARSKRSEEYLLYHILSEEAFGKETSTKVIPWHKAGARTLDVLLSLARLL